MAANTSDEAAYGIDIVRNYNLRRGSTGPRVFEVQQVLNDLFGAGIAVDGIFGPETEGAVRAFQRANGLPVDGVIGVTTTAYLQDTDSKSIGAVVVVPLKKSTDGVMVAGALAFVGGGALAAFGAAKNNKGTLHTGLAITATGLVTMGVRGWMTRTVKAATGT